MADRAVEEFAAATTGVWDATTTTTGSDTVRGPQGAPITGNLTTTRFKHVTFTSPVLSTDVITLELLDSVAGRWISSHLFNPNGVATYVCIPPLNNNGTVISGCGIEQSATGPGTFRVVFAQYAIGTSQGGGVNYGWSVLNTSNSAWRLRKVSGGAVVGFPVGARNVIGDVSGTAVPAGFIGEVLSQSRLKSAATGLTTATTANVTNTSLTLTPGVWDISGVVGFDINSTTTVTILNAAIANASASLPTSDTIGVETSGQIRAVWTQLSAANNSDRSLFTGTARVSISVSTPYFLVTQATFAVSTANAYGSIRAVRVA